MGSNERDVFTSTQKVYEKETYYFSFYHTTIHLLRPTCNFSFTSNREGPRTCKKRGPRTSHIKEGTDEGRYLSKRSQVKDTVRCQFPWVPGSRRGSCVRPLQLCITVVTPWREIYRSDVKKSYQTSFKTRTLKRRPSNDIVEFPF